MASVESTSDERTVNNTMRHQYRVLSDAEKANMAAIKDKGLEFHSLLSGLGKSREISLALTKVEEAVMWGVKHITAVLVIALLLALCAPHAFATADVLTSAEITAACGVAGYPPCQGISLKPWIEFIQPYLTATATVIVPIIVAALANKLSSWLGVSMDATQVARLKSAAATEAGALIAQADDNLASKVIKVDDPKIVAAAQRIIARLPATATAVGATPEALQKMIQGEVGKLQAGVITPDPIAPKA